MGGYHIYIYIYIYIKLMKLVFLAPWSVQILGKKYEVSSKAYYSLLGHISRESCESENLVWADRTYKTEASAGPG